MKHVKRVLLAIVAGVFMMHLISWTKGNENMYTYSIEKEINPKNIRAKDRSYDVNYYSETTVVKTVTPSSFPLCFKATYDTLPSTIISKYK